MCFEFFLGKNSLYHIQPLYSSIKRFESSRMGVESTTVICEIMYNSLSILHRLTLMTPLSFPCMELSYLLSLLDFRFRIKGMSSLDHCLHEIELYRTKF
jgi:hypothetical protein